MKSSSMKLTSTGPRTGRACLSCCARVGVLLAVALGKIRLAIARIRLERQPGAALPFLDPEGAGADGTGAKVGPGGLHDLARDGATKLSMSRRLG